MQAVKTGQREENGAKHAAADGQPFFEELEILDDLHTQERAAAEQRGEQPEAQFRLIVALGRGQG